MLKIRYNFYILVTLCIASDHMTSSLFHFMVNWFGNDFDGIDLGFNCNVTIDHIVRGDNSEAPHIDFDINGQNSNKMALNFIPAIVGAGGITIYASSESDTRPQITKVTLYKPNKAGKFDYSSSQIDQINEKLWPQ